jgi:ketosteroid isomerase-like protein
VTRVDIQEAATRWAKTWERAWPEGDSAAIASLYAEDATYRSHPLKDPIEGGARAYTAQQFAAETDVRCRFGSPIAAGERAAVEWWASWIEDDRELTLVGTTVLRFNTEGRVVEHVDYWGARTGSLLAVRGLGALIAGQSLKTTRSLK